ncbi:hypothetical protein [Campylobacter lanienae]|uniref:hypothetical protein n=1 Tax=Campylobacter lanienae TaxID=75658 RepID=UPI00112F9A3B|nr:hypothetical protein [Campylobacter lanienae]
MKDKKQKYLSLIERARQNYEYEKHENFKWCDECKKAINLWTYWQGLGYEIDTPKIRILLVAQDWGNTDFDGGKTLENISKINLLSPNEYEKRQYLDDLKPFVTDKNLVELFTSIGYPNIDKKRYSDLFFTNISLGYRTINTSAHITKAEISTDKEIFKELVEILEPEYIIALGKNTYEIILEALELERPKIASFNHFIVTQNGLEYGKIKIYAMAHAGGMGSANRKKSDKSNRTSIELQKEDWIKIFFNMT